MKDFSVRHIFVAMKILDRLSKSLVTMGFVGESDFDDYMDNLVEELNDE